MSNTGSRVKPEAVREIVYNVLTTEYQPLGDPFRGVLRYFTGDNGTDTDIYLTLDPTEDQFRLRPNQVMTYDLKTNDITVLPGQVLYIRSKSLPSEGDAFFQCASS